jgi:pimeloyl-ACP methyl ester carboxylesterase
VTPRRSWTRTLVLLAIVLEVPFLARAVRGVTPEPRVESIVVDGVPVELVIPVGDGPWPALHFVTGAHPERRREPVVQRVSRGLARAGFLVVVPDLPGLGEGELTPRTFEAARSVTDAVSQRPDVRDGRIALAGASAGAGIAIVTAARPELADRISVVAAVVPFADVERIACLATTSHYARNGSFDRYEVTALLRRVVARSLVTALKPGDDRSVLLELLRAQDPDDVDAVRCLAMPGRVLGLDARLVVDVLLNEDHTRFPELYKALPSELVDDLRTLSPAACASAVRAPVEVIAPPDDPYFPLPEAEAVVGLVPRGRLTVTRVLNHTRPSLAVSHIGDFVRFLGWVRRCLGAAAA